MSSTPAERKRAQRLRLRKSGYRPFEFWLKPEELRRLQEFLRQLRKRGV